MGEFAVVVEEDGLREGRGDGEDVGGGVEGGEEGGFEIELADVVGGVEVPEADGVVGAAGEEGVFAGVHGDGCYGGGVAAEVADVGVVVGGEEAECVCGWC